MWNTSIIFYSIYLKTNLGPYRKEDNLERNRVPKTQLD